MVMHVLFAAAALVVAATPVAVLANIKVVASTPAQGSTVIA
jgi:hypothetical protein